MDFERVRKPQDLSFGCHIRDEEKFDFQWHYHPEYELTLILSGSGKRYVGDNIFAYSQGDLVLIGPSLPHSWKSVSTDTGKSARNKAVVVQFSKDFMGRDFFDHPEMADIKHLLKDSRWGTKFIFNKPADLHNKIVAIASLSGFQRLLKFLEVLDLLSKCQKRQTLSTPFFAEPQSQVEQKRIEKIFNYIHNNYTGNISLAQIASSVHMSPSNFSQYFKKIAGRSFITYLNDIKISKACELLANTGKTVTEICYDCGFNNLSNFNRQFLKRKGASPRQYRKEYFDKQLAISD